MYAYDNADKINGLGRSLRAISSAPTLDPEDLDLVFRRLAYEVERATDAAVVNLRRQGHSWASIGAGLGMSRQSAHERYGVMVAAVLAADVPVA